MENAGFTLSREELEFVLHVQGVQHVVGLKLSDFDLPASELSVLLSEGSKSLERKGLVGMSSEGVPIFDNNLLRLVKVLAFRKSAVLLVRYAQGRGRQRFVFNFWKGLLVEHALPGPDLHHVRPVQSLEFLLRHLEQLIPLAVVAGADPPEIPVSEADIEALRALAHSGEYEAARNKAVLLGLNETPADRLVSALAEPQLVVSLAFLKCSPDAIVNATSVSAFGDGNSAWGIWPSVEGDSRFSIRPTGFDDLWAAWIRWLQLMGSSLAQSD